jgi:hypothetical protein
VSSGSESRLSAREGSGITTCPTSPDPASPMGGLRLFHVSHGSRLRLVGGLRCRHVSHGSGLASRLGRFPVPPCVPWLWILPPFSRGLQRCYVSRGSGSCLPPQEGSNATMCPAAPDPTSLLRRVWRCHVSHDSGSCLPAREGSNVAMYPTAPDTASLLGRAPALPHVLRLYVGHRHQE